MKWALDQRKAVEALVKEDGWVGYDIQLESLRGKQMPELPGSIWLDQVLGYDFFRKVVYISLKDASDADLEILQNMNQIEYLHLRRLEIIDVSSLFLEDVEHKNVKEVEKNNITDAGLEKIKGLKRLNRLDLSRTPISDAGLKYIEGLKELHSLNLCGTQVTVAGVAKLQNALPNCEISR